MRRFRFLSIQALIVAALAFSLFAAPLMAQTVTVRTRPEIKQFLFAAANGDATNQTYVTVTAKDANGNPIPFAHFLFYWSDSAAGVGITATASSGTSGLLIGTGAGSATGSLINDVTAATPNVATSRVPMHVATSSAGTVVIGVIDSAKTLFYPVAMRLDCNCAPSVGTKLATANYK